jgi:hypothetical protein
MKDNSCVCCGRTEDGFVLQIETCANHLCDSKDGVCFHTEGI